MKTHPPFEDPLDEVIARKLEQITAPDGLRERLLAVRPTKTPVPVPVVKVAPNRRRRSWGVTALAAVLVLGLLATGIYLGAGRGGAANEGDSLALASAEFAELLNSGFGLEMRSGDLAEIEQWYAARNAGSAVAVPAELRERLPVGCREIEWEGQRGALICFKLEDGRLAHLVVLPSGAFENPPGSEPVVARVAGWERSAWSADGMTYLVFAPPDALNVI